MRLLKPCLFTLACILLPFSSRCPGAPVTGETTAYTANFDAFPDSPKWAGDDGWKIEVPSGADFTAAIGKAYGKEGKGLLLQNKQVKDAKVWSYVRRRLDEVLNQPRFAISFDFFVAPDEEGVGGRLDVGLTEAGSSAAPVSLAMEGGRILFVGREPKADEAGGTKGSLEFGQAKVEKGQWHHVRIEVDQDKGCFRVLLDAAPVSQQKEEWFPFRKEQALSPSRAKTLAFSVAAAWLTSTRHIDNLVVSVPGK